MGRRVFTKHLAGGFQVPALGPNDRTVDTVLDQFMAEEDIEIIGWQHTVRPRNPSNLIGNDGMAKCLSILTTAPPAVLEGMLSDTQSYMVWNTTPAAVQITDQTVSQSLPDGYSVPVKEEGVITLYAWGFNGSAAEVGFYCRAIIFYVKRGK